MDTLMTRARPAVLDLIGNTPLLRLSAFEHAAPQVELYEQLVLKHAQGWPELSGRDDSAELPKSRERALTLGAAN